MIEDEETVSGKPEADRNSHSTELTHNSYTVGWVCALPKEQTAATAMLDQRHADLPKPPNDPNTYTLGSVGKHNVVIVCLPKGKIGTISAATVATWMVSTFPSIKFGLMVGIGGGIPPKVRLGDVVVSTPVGQVSGVVQWDSGKATDGGEFERTGSLDNPPILLLTALAKLETQYDLTGSKIPEYLEELKRKWPRLAPKYLKSDSLEDILFKTDYGHVSESITDYGDITDTDRDTEENCRFCDRTKAIKRKPRDIRVHYGLIASGNQVIKDAAFRDRLNKDLGGSVLCVEMEAAGLMNNFPCIVIRGICDYADSHKNKDWQEYAAAVAAAFAKELLGYVQPSDIDGERPVREILGQVFDTISKIGANVAQLKSKSDRDEDAKILDWLTSTSIDYTPQQSDFLKRRQPGTGQWLLDSTEFQAWLENESQTLFCPGIPGAGKTTITSIIVDYLCSRFQNDPSVGIAYLYCKSESRDMQTPQAFFESILKQLVQQQSTLPQMIKDLYEQNKGDQGKQPPRPQLQELLEALQSVLYLYSRPFIIVDALDECQDDDGCRSRFLTEIFKLQNKTPLNLLVTSRPQEIAARFNRCTSLEIRATAQDIQLYLDDQILQWEQSHNKPMSKGLRDKVKADITTATEGMFLLAYLNMNSLKSQETLRGVKDVLQRLSKGEKELDEAYRRTMERIQGQGRKLYTQILAWILHAKRPLFTTELQCALAIRPHDTKLDKDGLPTVQTILSACAGLVRLDEKSKIFDFVHGTTREYFENTKATWFPDAEKEIAGICITYLSFSVFESGICQTDGEFEERRQLNQFYTYAARNWGHHARTTSSLPHEIYDFFKSRAKLGASTQALMVVKKNLLDEGYSQLFPTHMTGLHLSAYFGISRAVEHLLKKYPVDPKDSHRRTPLSWAAAKGHKDVVRLLLENGADIESKDMYYSRTPLSWAAKRGYKDIVQLLLWRGAEIESGDISNQTPLILASAEGYKDIVQLLLEKGADPDSKHKYHQTSLLLAATRGHRDVVQLLLENGADLESENKDGQTPLICAANGGHTDVVRLLLKKGANLYSEDKGRWTPLSLATQRGDEDIVLLLIENGIDVESKNKDGQTPLIWATTRGYRNVLQLLLEKGADPNWKPKFHQTLLSLAAEGGHRGVIQLLLEKGAEIESKSFNGTPLSIAAEKGHEAVVQLLLEKGANIESKDPLDGTPLLIAARKGYRDVVQLLLEKGADIESKSFNGTPLSTAAWEGHEAIVRLLLEKGADLESKDMGGWTPLSIAAERGHETVVQLLLEKGADIESHSFNGTPLSNAAGKGHEAVVQLLLERGADIESKYYLDGTPLSKAAEGGHEAVVELLLARGADPESKDRYGRTPLSCTVIKGHEAVVRVLVKNRAEVESKDKDSRTLLSRAAERGHEAIVKLLLDNGADPDSEDNYGRTPLSYAAIEGHDAIAGMLLNKGARVNSKDTSGETPLSQATVEGQNYIVRLLLHEGAEVDSKDNNGRTPLSYAAEKGDEYAIKLLLDKGAEVESKDNHGETPLSYATKGRRKRAVKLLQAV